MRSLLLIGQKSAIPFSSFLDFSLSFLTHIYVKCAFQWCKAILCSCSSLQERTIEYGWDSGRAGQGNTVHCLKTFTWCAWGDYLAERCNFLERKVGQHCVGLDPRVCPDKFLYLNPPHVLIFFSCLTEADLIPFLVPTPYPFLALVSQGKRETQNASSLIKSPVGISFCPFQSFSCWLY